VDAVCSRVCVGKHLHVHVLRKQCIAAWLAGLVCVGVWPVVSMGTHIYNQCQLCWGL
jgi:hypothetical protein